MDEEEMPKKVPHLERRKWLKRAFGNSAPAYSLRPERFTAKWCQPFVIVSDQIYSIELHPELHESLHCASIVSLMSGFFRGTVPIPPGLRPKSKGPALSGSMLTSGASPPGVRQIRQYQLSSRTVLKCGRSDAALVPAITELEKVVKRARPDYDFTVIDYIIRITPSTK